MANILINHGPDGTIASIVVIANLPAAVDDDCELCEAEPALAVVADGDETAVVNQIEAAAEELGASFLAISSEHTVQVVR